MELLLHFETLPISQFTIPIYTKEPLFPPSNSAYIVTSLATTGKEECQKQCQETDVFNFLGGIDFLLVAYEYS